MATSILARRKRDGRWDVIISRSSTEQPESKIIASVILSYERQVDQLFSRSYVDCRKEGGDDHAIIQAEGP